VHLVGFVIRMKCLCPKKVLSGERDCLRAPCLKARNENFMIGIPQEILFW
jgi:hypothetical protein